MPNLQLRRTVQFSFAILVTSALCAIPGHAEPPAAPTDAKSATDVPKPKRDPIYDSDADGKELIAAAVKRAKLEGRHVLIEWGGNWCGWCHKLHHVFHHDELVHPIVAEEYELVLVDSSNNRELMESYGGKDTKYAFPHLTILDAQGKVLTNQETSSLEIGPKHDPQAVATFLKKWVPAVGADNLLSSAQRQATDEDKRILLHVGTPHCGWCRILTKFLSEHDAILSRDYVDLRLDMVRMQRGDEVTAPFLPANCEGVPWMVILDANGKVLSTSVGPMGNCGYPLQPAEIDHFISMLAGTTKRLGADDLQRLRTDLNAYRIERENANSLRVAPD